MASPLTVLTDTQIHDLLDNLLVEELESFRGSLKAALHEYSTGTQSLEDGDIHQPHRTSINSARTGATTLFMPCSAPTGIGMKVITLSPPQKEDAAPDEAKPVVRPTGAITIFSKTGCPLGFLHASTLTAFRTALASACLVTRRNTVRTLTVFGVGEQAYWHVRLALMLRGDTIRHVNFVNRRFSDSCRLIMKRFFKAPSEIKQREGWTDCEFSILTPGYVEYSRLLQEQIRAADIIFCCTPSTQPLFDASILTSHQGRRKGRLVVAIGSYTAGMHELPAELLRQATKPHGSGHHFHKHAPEGGVIIVDTLDGALKEAGEIIEAGLTPKQLVELGELVMLHRIAAAESEQQLADDDASSRHSAAGSSISGEFEKLDLTSSGSAMSSVYGPSAGSSNASTTGTEGTSLTNASTRSSSSPTRKSSGIFHRRRSSSPAAEKKKHKDDHLARWLQEGNVIYKSVGLGLMDLTVGLHLIEYAKSKGVGTFIDGFSA